MSTTATIKTLSVYDIIAMQDAGETLFVRWSRGPQYDTKPSRDYANGGQHAGVSAVELGYWDEAYMSRRLKEYRFLRIKDSELMGYIYKGAVVGTDSDGYQSLAVESLECVGVWDEQMVTA